MNLDHEYAKIQQNYNKRIISEEQYNYECYKLKCTSDKYNLGWKCPIRISESAIDQSLIDDDYKELKSLYENGLLKKAYYSRDLKKIISICESLKVPFPGPKTIKESLNINYISSLITENELTDGDELYDELDDENEYGEEDEVAEPELDSSVTIGNITLEQWIVGSEYEYKVRDENIDNYIDMDIYAAMAYILDNHDEIRNCFISNYIKPVYDYYLKTDDQTHTKLYSEILNSLKNKRLQSNPELSQYFSPYEFFDVVVATQSEGDVE